LNPREKGFLLLSGYLGNPERKVLTVAQMRTLAHRMQTMERPADVRELTQHDLEHLGYGREMAERILSLLGEEDLLDHYLMRARRAGCVPITRVSEGYPLLLRKRLGLDSPGCLWARGDLSIMKTPGISLVGSRELDPENEAFAREAGRQAALQGLVLISGNARGADRTAQEACLESGGQVISVVADVLESHPLQENVLYLSEDGFDMSFSPQRALSRNRVIHALGRMVFVAQARAGAGGTWSGVTKNLRHGWSGVACFRDGSEAMKDLEQLGAYLVDAEDLQDLAVLIQPSGNFLQDV